MKIRNWKSIQTIGAIVLVAVLIATGVHLLHRDAFAQQDYSVYLWRAGQGNVTDATVWFTFDGGDNWIQADHTGGGFYTVVRDNAELEWQIYLDVWANPDYIGLEPWWGFYSDVLWGNDPSQVWEVEPGR